jgi:hypothetical protein
MAHVFGTRFPQPARAARASCVGPFVRGALTACALSLAVALLGLAACNSAPVGDQAEGGAPNDAGGEGMIDAADDHSFTDATTSGIADAASAIIDAAGAEPNDTVQPDAGMADAAPSDATTFDGGDTGAGGAVGVGAEPVEGGGGGTLCGATCGPGQMLCPSPPFAGSSEGPGIYSVASQAGFTACFPESAAGCAGLPNLPMYPPSEFCGADGGCDPGLTTCCGGICLDTTSDPRGCGPCIGCAASNGSAVCINSKCVVACLPGWTHCGTSCSVTTADAANCGACGNACAASEICTGSACLPQSSVWLVTGLTSPSEINVDKNNVYWSDSTLNSISGVPKAGGSTFTVVPPQSTALTSIVLDDMYLYYWQGATIMRAPKDGTGCCPQIVATISMQGLALGVDSTSVYFTGLPSMVPPTIQSVPKGGGIPTTYLTTSYAMTGFPPTFFDAVSDNLAMYVMVNNGNLRGGSGQFAAFDFAGTVGGPDVTGDFLIPEYHMGVDATNVYAWYDFGIEAFNKYGGFAGAAGISPPYAGASCGVAWANSSGINWNALVSMANGGYDDYFEQAAQIIAPGVGPVVNMIADGDSIYWTDSGNGAIGKLRLP